MHIKAEEQHAWKRCHCKPQYLYEQTEVNSLIQNTTRTYRAPAGCASAWPSYSSPAVPCKPQSVSFLYPAHLFVPHASSFLPVTGFGKLHLLVRYKGGERRALNKPAIQTVHTTAFLTTCGENLSHTSTQMCKKRRDSLLMCT